MKRREFLRRTMLGAVAVAVPVALIKSNIGTSGTPPPALTSEMVREIVAAMKDRELQPIDGDYYMVGHPKDDFAKLMHGETGYYEGVRFIEQTHVPSGVPKRTHSYLDLVGNKWAWT